MKTEGFLFWQLKTKVVGTKVKLIESQTKLNSNLIKCDYEVKKGRCLGMRGGTMHFNPFLFFFSFLGPPSNSKARTIVSGTDWNDDATISLKT